MPTKLVQNKKIIKLSREKSTVKGALQRALDDSHKESWKKVVIIGIGETKTQLRHTAETDITLLGMLELAKQMITKDI